MSFSQDRDLLIFEPRLFAELAWPGQVLASNANGQLTGSAFVSPSANFPAAGIGGGGVLCIAAAGSSAPPASYEIVAVESPTRLVISALRASPADPAIAPAVGGSALVWHVTSFTAQAEAVAMEMLAHFGLSPADPSSPWSANDIAHPEALRSLSAYGVLATVLAGAAGGGTPDGYWTKAVHYRGLFDRGMQRVRLGLDRNRDGRTDVVRQIGAARLRRD